MKLQRLKPFTLLIVVHAAVLLVAAAVLITRKGTVSAGRDKIIVIPIEGVISMDPNALGSGASVNDIVKSLKKISEDDSIDAVVLRINSPGGSVGAVQEIYRGLKKVKASGKPIVASFGDVSASGGYYLACAADRIITNPGTITGSIGVIFQVPNMQGLLQKVGVSMQTIKSGAMKDAGSPFRRMTESEKEHLDKVIQDAYGQFFEAVKTGRNMDDKTLKPLADGRIFSGRMAMDHKLADELGGLEEAVEAAKTLSGLEGKKPEIIYHKEKPTLERLMRLVGWAPIEPLKSLAFPSVELLYLLQ